MSARARIVAVTGVDGTGKTTLVRRLAAHCVEAGLGDPPETGVAVVGRGPSPAESRVVARYPRRGEPLDWVDTEFGNAVALACALDFCGHWEGVLEPLARRARVMVSDRWATCFTAYARCLARPDEAAEALLATVPAPDLVLHLTAPPEVIARRIAERVASGAAPPDEFEDPRCQARLAEGYGSVFADLRAAGVPVVEVDNGGAPEEGLARLEARLREAFEGWGLEELAARCAGGAS